LIIDMEDRPYNNLLDVHVVLEYQYSMTIKDMHESERVVEYLY